MMSLNSNKITVYSSPQAQYLTACPTGTSDQALAESSVNCVPKRTTYRLKICNSKDVEVLSAAAKLGLTSWVGGHKVRIVDVVPKQCSEFAAAKSQVTVAESRSLPANENGNNFSRAGSASHPADCRYASSTNWSSSSAFGEQRNYPGCCTASVPSVSDSKSCTSLSASDTQSVHVVTSTPLQTFVTSTCQSSLVSNHYLPGGSLKTTADIGMSSRHGRNESLKSLTKPCEPVVPQGLAGKIRYLGTIAVNTQNVTTDCVGAESSPLVTETSVISAVKKFTESLNGNKLSNGKHLNGAAITCIKNNHVWKTNNQPLSQSQNFSAFSARGLKRPYVEEDYKTNIVSNKKIAHSVKCPTDCVDISSFSDATKSGTPRQPLTSNVLNQVAARVVNCGQYTGYSQLYANDTMNNSQQTVEVNNNCSSQQSSSLHLVPKFRLPSGSGML